MDSEQILPPGEIGYMLLLIEIYILILAMLKMTASVTGTTSAKKLIVASRT